jgi:hypothetical protein
MAKTLKLQFPMKGKNTNFAATTQPSFTSPRMNRVVARDTLDYRARGGQEPGWAKAYNQHPGYVDGVNDVPVVAIGQVTIVEL